MLSDRVNAILVADAPDWAAAATSVFGIIRGGALAQGYAEADFPPITDPIRFYVAALGGGGAPWGFVPLSVPEDHRPFVQPLRQAYELRAPARAVFAEQRMPAAEWPAASAFALVIELGAGPRRDRPRHRDAPRARDRQRHGQDRADDRRAHARDRRPEPPARLRRCGSRTNTGIWRSVFVWYLGVVGPRLDGPRPPRRLLVAGDLARQVVAGDGAVLELDVRLLDEVVVPDRVLRGAAERRDDRVDAVVLDAHQRGLAQLAGPGTDGGEDDHGTSAQVGGLGAARRLVLLGLLAGPGGRCRARTRLRAASSGSWPPVG